MGGDACGIGEGLRRELNKLVAELGERTLHAPAMSVGKDKFDVRRGEGVWR